MEYPKTLYVVEETHYPYVGCKQLVGRSTLESSVPDNDKDNTVATYQLVSVDSYKKTVSRSYKIEKAEK